MSTLALVGLLLVVIPAGLALLVAFTDRSTEDPVDRLLAEHDATED